MKCQKCGAKVTSDDAFCPECGAKVEEVKTEKVEKHVKKEKKIHSEPREFHLPKKALIIGGIILAVLIIASVVIFAVPMPYSATQQYVETVPYDAQESYSEKEPYSATETYYESESYKDQECEYRDYDGKGGYISEDGSQKWDWYVAHSLYYSGNEPNTDTQTRYYITNYENKMGSFKIKISFWNWDNDKERLGDYIYKTIIVGPHETEYGYIYYSVLWNNKLPKADTFAIQLEEPQLEECETVTKWRDVPKTRTVTKYRDETKYRTVTKHKDEYNERSITKKATLFNIWTGNVKYYYAVGE